MRLIVHFEKILIEVWKLMHNLFRIILIVIYRSDLRLSSEVSICVYVLSDTLILCISSIRLLFVVVFSFCGPLGQASFV